MDLESLIQFEDWEGSQKQVKKQLPFNIHSWIKGMFMSLSNLDKIFATQTSWEH